MILEQVEMNNNNISESENKLIVLNLCAKSINLHYKFNKLANIDYLASIELKRFNSICYFVFNAKELNKSDNMQQSNFSNKVIFLATSILDLYLMNCKLDISMSLLRETVWWMACKIVYRQCQHKKFKLSKLYETETKIMRALNYDLNIPHTLCLLESFAMVTDLHKDVVILTQFILEILLFDYKAALFPNANLAAAALGLSLLLLHPNDCAYKFSCCTGFEAMELRHEVTYIQRCLFETERFVPHIIAKYNTSQYSEVAKLLFNLDN